MIASRPCLRLRCSDGTEDECAHRFAVGVEQVATLVLRADAAINQLLWPRIGAAVEQCRKPTAQMRGGTFLSLKRQRNGVDRHGIAASWGRRRESRLAFDATHGLDCKGSQRLP
jgi:hypothetical protein